MMIMVRGPEERSVWDARVAKEKRPVHSRVVGVRRGRTVQRARKLRPVWVA
jgi:hypothetical protein